MIGAAAGSFLAGCILVLGPPGGSPLGEAICAFAREQVGERVGDGQCSTLATLALESAGAKTVRDFPPRKGDGDEVWGEEVRNPRDVHPGDVVQYRKVQFRRMTVIRRGAMRAPGIEIVTNDHHTAIVAKVLGRRRFVIYEQNVTRPGEPEGMKWVVRESPLDLAERVRGTIRFYRPVPREGAGPRGPGMEPSPPQQPEEGVRTP
jgi:hypothetical protein